MSVLIDELEARKNDYILVADVINAMAEATNSTSSQVVNYLEAHGVNAHLPMFYMDEYYSFDPIDEWLCQVGENDAKTTYFRKSDVVAFEQIAKHGVFKDGSLYHINHLQRNSEDEYLTLDEVSLILSNEARIDFDYNKIRDLARKKKITPCFYFSGFVCPLFKDPLGELYISNSTDSNSKFKMMTGYFTYRLLVEQISSQDDYLTVPSCEVGNEIRIHRLLERQDDTHINYSNGLALFESKPQPFDDYNNKKKFSCICFDEIRFSKQELDGYLASLANTSQDDTPAQNDSKLLAKVEQLQAENDDLNARLSTARNTYKQHQNEIKELKSQLEKANADSAELKEQLSNKIDAPADESILQTILDESHEDHAPDLKHAIQLWIDLYIHGGIKSDSHSSKANIWIRTNTNYAENANSSIGRIREIATPLKDFGAKRSREEEK